MPYPAGPADVVRGEQRYFSPRAGCPFCGTASADVLAVVRYHETAEANRSLPDLEGRLFSCGDCGVAYPSHSYDPAAFPLLYAKSLTDLDYFDRSVLQVLRKAYIKAVLRDRSGGLARLLDAISGHCLQIPLISRRARGLEVLDVGCGFGEFLEIFHALGNEVVGTEIVPDLAARLHVYGFDVREGEIESIPFGGRKFDLIVMRAVFYRTRNPRTTLATLMNVLAPGAELSLLDPCPEREGVEYFFRKQFPQGQFYILDAGRYLGMLESRFGLRCGDRQLIYGRPTAPLKRVRILGNLVGLSELLSANVLRRNPYVLNYTLRTV